VEHEKLVGLLNDLYDGFHSGTAKSTLEKVLDALVDYTATHFGHEERLFDQVHYADTDAHKREHAALVKQVLEIQAKFEADPNAVLSQDVMGFLKNWLTKHILGTDKRYVPAMKAAGIP